MGFSFAGAASMEMQVLEATDSLSRVALLGMLDLGGVSEVETRFLAATVARGKPTIVDLAGLSFISSLGMGMLLTAVKGLKRKGAKLVLLHPQPNIVMALKAARLHELLPLVDSEEQARQMLAAE